jgi:hypothetical protein
VHLDLRQEWRVRTGGSREGRNIHRQWLYQGALRHSRKQARIIISIIHSPTRREGMMHTVVVKKQNDSARYER